MIVAKAFLQIIEGIISGVRGVSGEPQCRRATSIATAAFWAQDRDNR
jgi:hypothetical protein